jgi:hypothetical protein
VGAITFKDFFTNHVLPNEAILETKKINWQNEAIKFAQAHNNFKKYTKIACIFSAVTVSIVLAHAFLRGSTVCHKYIVVVSLAATARFYAIAKNQNLQKIGLDYLIQEITSMSTKKIDYIPKNTKFPVVPSDLDALDIFIILEALNLAITEKNESARNGILTFATAKKLDNFLMPILKKKPFSICR